MRVLRCFAVSVGTTVLSAVVLAGLVVWMAVPAATANILAVLVGIVPSYWFNRRWVWGRDGRGDLWGEVVPFWAMSIAGLVASTAVVSFVAAASVGWPAAWRSVLLGVANAATFASLWVVQFLLLDRVIFTEGRRTATSSNHGTTTPAIHGSRRAIAGRH